MEKPMNTAAISHDLRTKVIADPSVPLDLRRVSLRAACALQVMSDRNFDQAPQSIKQMCRTALSECTSAWADHGAQMKG
jgi:hypothetical protein